MRFACLLLIAIAAQGQIPFPVPEGNQESVAVRGQVVAPRTRQPVRGARVTVHMQNSPHTATSDARGVWRLDAVPPGIGAISIAKPGYAEFERMVVVPAGEELEAITAELPRLGVITGRVTDAVGQPVEGARISLLEEFVESGERSFARAQNRWHGSSSTDDRGVYRLWGLTPGRYIVAVAPSAHSIGEGKTQLEQAQAYAPSATRIDDAQTIELSHGEIVEALDIALPEAQPTQVLGSLGGACRECNVAIYEVADKALPYVARVRVSRLGEFFVAGLPEGEYLILARRYRPGDDDMRQGYTAFSVVRQQLSVVQVEMGEGHPLQIRVVHEGRPEDRRARGPGGGASARVETRRLYVEAFMSGPRFHDRAAEDGDEALLNLRLFPGPYRFRVGSSGNGYVDRMEAAGRPLRSPMVNEWASPLPDEITVYLRYDHGMLEGKVEGWEGFDPRDATPGLQPPMAMLRAIPTGSSDPMREPQFVWVGPGGQINARLAPGTYQLYELLTRGRSFLSTSSLRASDEGKSLGTVTIRSGETTTAHLTLDAAR